MFFSNPMTPELTLLNGIPYFDPLAWTGWLGWLVLFGLLLAAAFRWRGKALPGGRRWVLLAVFLFLVPLANLFLALRLPSGTALPVPGLPAGARSPSLLVLSALPWMLAGGFLGPLEAVVVGLATGLVRGLWDTHGLFSLLEPAVLALLFSLAVRQRYRTWFYAAVRQPVLVGLGLAPVHALIFIYGALLSVPGAAATRLDYALTNLTPAVLASGGELLAAGLFAQVLRFAFPRAWGVQKPLEPSPSERSLQTRVLLAGGSLIAVLLLALVLGDWILAGNAARRMLRDRLASTAETASGSVPFLLETGQSLASRLAADPRLLSDGGEALRTDLAAQMQTFPYFDQLYVLDLQGTLLAAYPPVTGGPGLTQAESAGLALAGSGVPVQTYTIPPAAGQTSARLSFLASIPDAGGTTRRILLGRSLLTENPLAKPLLDGLRGMSALGGTGKLLDDQGRVLFSPNPGELMAAYAGRTGKQALFYDLTAPGGTRDLVYYQPVPGQAWAVVLSVPAVQAQQLTLEIAGPLALLVLVLAAAALLSLWLSLRVVTGSLRNLAGEAARISQGKLDHPLPTGGADEVGQLRQAFEQMRQSLRARLDELNQLLQVSQGVASTLELGGAVQPVLEALLSNGASAARLVLPPPGRGQEEMQRFFALGPAAERFAGLDEAILARVEKQGRLVVGNTARGRVAEFPEQAPRPEALAAVPLTHDNRTYGVLWAAYDTPRNFTEENLRFLTTLAGQAALAAANARLFRTAEVGRQRLAAILASTPDPVLVTDQDSRLILANPAAKRALGAKAAADNLPTERVIGQQELRDLLKELEGGKKSAEMTLPDGKVYYATASLVVIDGRPVGRVCVMRDVTHFKQLDALKSDFVASVSHDLRSPLTLMRGYATMLSMVGKLNEQQTGYTAKIVTGVDSMAKLVNNLLDLGRIEAGVGLEVEAVPLRELGKNVVESLLPLADQKEIDLGVEAGKDLPEEVEGDRALLQQALYNLVENAIKYTPAKGRVVLRMQPQPEAVCFEVQDTGIGISPADQSRLFEKFFRGSQREARAERGSGLGLAIVRSVAEQHRGKVWVESQLGKGSTFFLIVPRLQPEGTPRKASNGK
jgi:PAS domain S-box-containing protein